MDEHFSFLPKFQPGELPDTWCYKNRSRHHLLVFHRSSQHHSRLRNNIQIWFNWVNASSIGNRYMQISLPWRRRGEIERLLSSCSGNLIQLKSNYKCIHFNPVLVRPLHMAVNDDDARTMHLDGNALVNAATVEHILYKPDVRRIQQADRRRCSSKYEWTWELSWFA